MLERLHFVLGGCVGEGTQNSDRIVALYYYYNYYLTVTNPWRFKNYQKKCKLFGSAPSYSGRSSSI